MPIYEYRCRNGHTFEVMQRMSDVPVSACELCESPVERIFRPVAVHFKGSGFYTTDYGRNRSGSGDAAGGSGDSGKESKETATTKSESGSVSSDSSAAKSDSGSAKKAESS